jgi:nucleosome binding factor SPN SPT16 subunit
MKVPEGYSGPAIELIEYDLKTGDLSDYISKLVAAGSIGKKTGCFKTDKEDSKLTTLTLQAIGKESEIVEMMPLLKLSQMVKVESEVTNLRQSSRFTAWLFRRIVEYIEDILENEKEVKHTKI